MRLITRRTFLRLLWSYWGSPHPASTVREYRASANIRLFGMTLLSVQSVGGARVTYESHWGAAGLSRRLSFVAGSDPARARGLNRLGYIRETVCSESNAVLSTEYLGFMTASKEDSLEDARAALASPTEPLTPFIAIEGLCGQHGYRVASASFLAPSPRDWSEYQLIEPLAVRACRTSATLTQRPVSAPAPTFLYCLMQVIHNAAPRSVHTFTYSKDYYWLQADRTMDIQTGRQLAARGLTASPDGVCRISCKVRNQRTRKTSSFTLWVQPGAACWLPLRFECRPKSYLKLIFDALPGAAPGHVVPEPHSHVSFHVCPTQGLSTATGNLATESLS